MIRLALSVGWAMTAGGEFGNLMRRVVVTRMQFIPGLRDKLIDSQHTRAAPLGIRPHGRA